LPLKHDKLLSKPCLLWIQVRALWHYSAVREVRVGTGATPLNNEPGERMPEIARKARRRRCFTPHIFALDPTLAFRDFQRLKLKYDKQLWHGTAASPWVFALDPTLAFRDFQGLSALETKT